MLLFGNKPGRVGMFVDSSTHIPVTIYMGGGNGVQQFSSVNEFKAVINSFDMRNEVNISGTNTLKDRIYFYTAGGNRIQPINIGGLMFPDVCHINTNGSGISDVMRYYETYRASSFGLPIRITVDPLLTLKGFMKGLNTRISDPQFGLGEFTFEFMGIPRRNSTIPDFGPLGGASL